MSAEATPARGNLARMRRTLTPGVAVRIVNHIRPEANRDTVVHEKTNTVDIVTWGTDKKGQAVASHHPWPKAKDLRVTESGVFHVLRDDGTPFLEYEVIQKEEARA